jgi:hypothetical protein
LPLECLKEGCASVSYVSEHNKKLAWSVTLVKINNAC